MFLTRIYLDPYRRGARKLMRSRQTMHAAVLNCFPPGSLDDAAAPRVLCRLDPIGPSVAGQPRLCTVYFQPGAA